ncbi:surface antigen [Plasmodium falciparum UGT5.1]|uniref:Surface antigen n=1 Tax=Plasmodium falciparum UGT5.1 TaxID=1237627 RepID=W7JKB1_PLAFA|nr:surface antigen [Plasmodium falciparum UGT5.1]
MKLNYTKILLFFFSLNILVTLYHVNNQTNPYITSHHTQTNRSLCECDTQSTNYNNDVDMKSVKENYDRQTSQRFEEYEERMEEKRQKRKEERDKNIKKIIEKDKMEKSLSEKIEKGCLRCGCGLGGVAASVGIFGAIAVKELTKSATAAAVQKGIDAGIAKAIDGLGNIVELSEFNLFDWTAMVTPTTYNHRMELVGIVNFINNKCTESAAAGKELFCSATKSIGEISSMLDVKTISPMAADVALAAGEAAKAAEEAEMVLVNAESSHLYSAIGYSVLAILIIVLVMLIIYLILRYRRKKKMKKKAQYTKLLNQ